MKKFIHLYDHDLRDIVIAHFDLEPEQVATVYTEDEDGNTEFYVEVEENYDERN